MPDAPTVSNSSCLIGLEAAGHLDILQQLYATIDVPEAVAQQCGSALPGWAKVQSVQNQSLVQFLRRPASAFAAWLWLLRRGRPDVKLRAAVVE